MKRTLTFLGGGIAALMFIPIIRDAVGGASFNPLTFLCWSSLSLVLTAVLIKGKESWFLPVCWVISDTIVGISLIFYFHQPVVVGKQEIFVGLLVVVCTAVWLTSKTWVSTIACTTALLLAAVPQTVDIYHHPENASAKIWGIYIVSNSLSFFGGKTWSIEDRVPAGASAIYCVLMTILSLR